MKLTYDELLAFLTNEGLHVPRAHHYVGSFKEIEDFSTKSRDGNAITGYATLFPDIHIKDDVVVADIHTVVWYTKGRFFSYLDSSTDPICDWISAERMMSTNEDIIYRSVKRDIPLSRWLASTVQSWCPTTSLYCKPCGTAIQRAADSIGQHMKFEGYDFNYDWLTGQSLVDRYRAFNNTSPSCMTGHKCEQVRLWSTNGKQCRLLVIKDGEHEIARTLCFRPGPTVDSLEDDLPLGPGWYYGRIYNVSSASSINMGLRVTQSIAWMRQKGLVEASLRNCPGAVPLIVTEYSPYIDRGYVFARSHDEGEDCYWTCEPEPTWLPSSRWEAIESNQYGSGFGRSVEDEDEGCSICSCCDGQSRNDDMTHVEDYGDVCEDCLNGGGFTFCLDDEWRPSDDVLPVYFSDMDEPIGYINDGRDTVSLWYDGRRHSFHRAQTIEKDKVYASEALTHNILGLDRLFAGNLEDLVEVKHKLTMDDRGFLELSPVVSDEPVFCLDEHSVEFSDSDGKIVTAYAEWLTQYSVQSTATGSLLYLTSGCVKTDDRLLTPYKHLTSIIYVDTENYVVMKLSKTGNLSSRDPSPALGSQWDGKIPVIKMSSRQIHLSSEATLAFFNAEYTLSREYPVHDSQAFKYGCYRSGWSNLPHPVGTLFHIPGINHTYEGPVLAINGCLDLRTVVATAGCNSFVFVGSADETITHALFARRSSNDRFRLDEPVVIRLVTPLYLDRYSRDASLDKMNTISSAIESLYSNGTVSSTSMNDETINILRQTINHTILNTRETV